MMLLGIGNPWRTDDGFGPAVLERLQSLRPDPPSDWVTCHQLTPELAEPLSRADEALFFDAREGGGSPGTWSAQPLHPSASTEGLLTHHLSAEQLLAMARDLYGRYPPARLVSAVGLSFAEGMKLTPPVEAAVRQVVEWVRPQLETPHA